MAADKEVKMALGFNFRATFFSETAKGALDEEVVRTNTKRVQKVREDIIQTLEADVTGDAEHIIKKIRSLYKQDTPVARVRIPYKELRLVSYNIPYEDFGFSKYIIDILEVNWFSSYTRGLVHSTLKHWTDFEPDIKTILCELISKYSPDTGKYLSEAGAYKLGYDIKKDKKEIRECCRIFNLSFNRISYSYFSEVMVGYYDSGEISDFDEVNRLLSLHNNKITDKRIISRLVINHFNRRKIPPALFKLAISRVGDPSVPSNWATPKNVSREDAEKIEKAKQIMIQIVSSRFIKLFYRSICDDTERLNFWLNHTDGVKDFKVYGSSYSRNKIPYNWDSSLIDSHFVVLNSKSDNCALVMHIDDFAIIEFSGGGALYVYKKGSADYKSIFSKRIEKIDDFKIPYLSNLIDNDYYYSSYEDEGRMVHIGNWQHRLDMWFRKKISKR